MDFKLDKQDIFRNVIPGSIFLLVIFSFFFAKNNFSIDAITNIQATSFILGITITLPIGYTIHNVYFAVHTILEQRGMYRFEDDILRRQFDKNENFAIMLKNSPRLGSYFVELCLHESGCTRLRERLYELISRLHSRGSCIVAVVLALMFSHWIFRLDMYKWHMRAVFYIWLGIIVSLYISRWSSKSGYKAFMRYLIIVRKDLIVRTVTKKIDSFKKIESPAAGVQSH